MNSTNNSGAMPDEHRAANVEWRDELRSAQDRWWVETRDLGYADLHALHGMLEKYRDQMYEQVRELLGSGDALLIDFLRDYYWLDARYRIVNWMLHFRLLDRKPMPGDPPNELLVDASLPDGLTPKQIDHAMMKANVRDEFKTRRDGDEKAKDIIKDLADRYNRSYSAIDGIVYPRNRT